jgi:2,3-diketo-5-methylthio-1-phosphopentane phosphatase
VKKSEQNGKENQILVLCDFDGTVSHVDVGHQILKNFSEDRWETIDRDYCAGNIGSMEAYTRIAEIIRASEQEFIEYLSQITRLDPAFPEFYDYCMGNGFELKIVSDGLDFYIGHILAKCRMERIPFFSNRLTFKKEREISIEFPLHNPECSRCGTCKKTILESHRSEYGTIIYIGDGYSDFCPSRYADLVFGKDILCRYCREENVSCVPYRDFTDILSFMEKRSFLSTPKKAMDIG